jgi:hypothetical protein
MQERHYGSRKQWFDLPENCRQFSSITHENEQCRAAPETSRQRLFRGLARHRGKTRDDGDALWGRPKN